MDKMSAKIILILSLSLFLMSAIAETRPIAESNNGLSSYMTFSQDLTEDLITFGPLLFLLGIFIIVFFVIYLILRNMKTTKKDLELSQKSIVLHEETNKLLKEIAEALKKK